MLLHSIVDTPSSTHVRDLNYVKRNSSQNGIHSQPVLKDLQESFLYLRLSQHEFNAIDY